MDDEKLINMVSNYPELYDLKNKNYMNQTRKNYIWKDIAVVLDVDDNTCKERWKTLRDGYHRSIKKRKSNSGDGAKNIKKYRFETQMEFLRPYFNERDGKINILTDMSDGDDGYDISTPSPSPGPVNSPGLSSEPTSTVFYNMTTRKKKTQPKSEVATILKKYLGSRNESTDPVHSFFKAMADTVANLSPELQIKVKNEVFSIVSQAELDNLRVPSTSSTLLQQKKPTTILPQDTETTEETQSFIIQPSQNILEPSQSIPTPQSEARYRYYIHPNGEITYKKN